MSSAPGTDSPGARAPVRSRPRRRWRWTPAPKRSKPPAKPIISFGVGEPDFPTPEPIKDAANRAHGRRRHPLHHGQRRPGAAQAGRRADRRDDRRAVHLEPGHRHQRRQGSAVHRHAGAVRPGRRSAAARAVLGQLRRAGQDGRRARRAHRRRRRRSGSSAPTTCARHLTPRIARAGAVHAQQSDRAPSTATRSSRRWPRCWPNATSPSSSTRSTRASATCRSVAGCAPRRSMADRSLIVDGVSKAYAMTGWRLGWLRRSARADGDGLGACRAT